MTGKDVLICMALLIAGGFGIATLDHPLSHVIAASPTPYDGGLSADKMKVYRSEEHPPCDTHDYTTTSHIYETIYFCDGRKLPNGMERRVRFYDFRDGALVGYGTI